MTDSAGESASPTDDASAGNRSRAGVWIVGVDGSECARHAALWTAAQAPGRATEIHLTTAWSPAVAAACPPFEPMVATANFDILEQNAREDVEQLANELRPTLDIPIQAITMRGGAASSLLDAADQGSMLVIGTRGRGGFSRLLLGSTSTQCSTHATVPTVAVPEGADTTAIESMLVAVDGSANSISALGWALEFAAPGAVIDCVSVWDVTPISVGADQFFFPEASDLARDRFTHLVETVRAEHADRDVEIRSRFIEGRPRTVLAELAADTDLFVMGARGHGAIGAAVLGSVSTWLLHHAKRPMVIVPHDAEKLDIGGDARQD